MTASKTVLVTGASRGMGLGYVRHYLGRDWAVVGTAISPENASALTSLRAEHRDRLIVERLRVTDDLSIKSLADRLAVRGVRLDLLINNAGVSEAEAFADWEPATFIRQFHTNAIGPALVARAMAPLMAPEAKLVNITSGMGSLEWNLDPAGPLAGYAASKAALNALTRRLSALLQPSGVTVVAINPGWVRTEMGGPEAPTPIDVAVAEITETIDRLKPSQSGQLLNGGGNPLPF